MSASPSSISPARSPVLGSPGSSIMDSGRFSPYVQMSPALTFESDVPASIAGSFAAVGPGGPEVVLFESYLHKTPPLKSIVMKWTKRWFVLSRKNASVSSITLSYYKDASKKEKRQTIDLSKFVGIRPNAKVGTKENVFAIETEDRKYILKAPDLNTKNIWLAKLCELCGQEQVYHITIPPQFNSELINAILKLSCPSNVTAVLPSSGKTLLDIPFEQIRRLGYTQAYGHDVVWFETCHNSLPEQFHFFTVPSGIEAGRQIVRDLKVAIECYTSSLLIMEDSSPLELSFIAREHYGCREFHVNTRNRILQTNLMQMVPQWRTMPTIATMASMATMTSIGAMPHNALHRESDTTALMRAMSCDSPSVGGVSLEEWAMAKGRKKPSVSSRTGQNLSRKPTLDQFFRQTSTSSFDRSLNHELSEGHFSDSIGSDVFEPAPNTSRLLSQQNSISSQSSTVSSHPSCSPAIMEEERETFVFDEARHCLNISSTGLSNSRSVAPVVPPRSMVSLNGGQQDTAYIESVA